MPPVIVFALGALAGAAGTLRCPDTARRVIAAVKGSLKKVAKTCLVTQESPSTSDPMDGEVVSRE